MATTTLAAATPGSCPITPPRSYTTDVDGGARGAARNVGTANVDSRAVATTWPWHAVDAACLTNVRPVEAAMPIVAACWNIALPMRPTVPMLEQLTVAVHRAIRNARTHSADKKPDRVAASATISVS